MSFEVIAITGFMAAGKTAVGRALAERLNCRFVDLDDEIVQRVSRSINDIIRSDGEARFRALETRVLAEVLRAANPLVVALGGGTWTIAENRALLKVRNAHLIWLDVPFEVCWQRIEGGSSRPLAPSRAIAERLYRERQPAYELAHQRVLVGPTGTAAGLAEDIAASLFQPKPKS